MQKRELEASGSEKQGAKHRKVEKDSFDEQSGRQEQVAIDVDEDEWEKFQALVHKEETDQQAEQEATDELVAEPDLTTFDTSEDLPSDDERLRNDLVLQKELDRRVENIRERVARMRKQNKPSAIQLRGNERTSQGSKSETERSEADEEEDWFQQAQTH